MGWLDTDLDSAIQSRKRKKPNRAIISIMIEKSSTKDEKKIDERQLFSIVGL